MTLERQVTFWVAALLILILSLWLLQGILLPFVAGLVLAYFIDPVADALERLGVPRIVATLLILGASILILALAVIILAPLLGDQVSRFIANLPTMLATLNDRFNALAPQWLKDLLARSGSNLSTDFSSVAGRVAVWLAGLLSSILTRGLALINLLSLIVITPVVAFYLLLDWDRMVAKVDTWLPRPHLQTIRGLAREMDQTMAGFIRGQSAVCLFLGVFYAVGLSVAGLNFGLLIGIGSGFLSFIPYVGSLTGAIVSIGMALVQFWPNWIPIATVAAIFAAGQFIEGNFLSPKLVGNRVGLHPVWLMFALFAFGYLFGFVGLLLAVPLAAAIGVLARFALRKYMASPIYLGETGTSPVVRGKK
jgi:predicted PurR-regulated permease PerM